MSVPYVRLPGLAGNYLSTPDVNLLDADTAHLQQSVGLWTGGTLSAEQAMFGSSSMKVLGGALASFTATSDGANMGVHIYSAGGGTFTVNGSSTVVPAGVWTHCPAASGNQSTYQVAMIGGDDYYIDACYVSDTLTTFVPSLRIVGALDARAKVVAGRQSGVIASKWETVATKDWAPLQMDASGGLTFYWSEDGSATGAIPGEVVIVPDGDDSPHEYRATFEPSTRAVVFYLDGVVAAAPTPSGASSLFGGSSELAVGASYAGTHEPLDGAVYWAEVRDGIDGPVVARFDASDIVLP